MHKDASLELKTEKVFNTKGTKVYLTTKAQRKITKNTKTLRLNLKLKKFLTQKAQKFLTKEHKDASLKLTTDN